MSHHTAPRIARNRLRAVPSGPPSPPAPDLGALSAEASALEELGERLNALYLADAPEVLAAADTHTAWLVPDFLPARSVALFVGAPGSGKSWLAYDLALATAQGRPFLGTTPETRGAVLILNYDSPYAELARRWKRLGLRATDSVFFHSIGRRFPDGTRSEYLPSMLRLPGALEAIEALVALHKPVLVVVDSLRACHLGNENDNQDMSRVMACFRAISSTATVVLIHHDGGKGGSSDSPREGVHLARGSSSIPADVDLQINITKAELRIVKSRLFDPAEPVRGYQCVDTSDVTTALVPSTAEAQITKFLAAKARGLAEIMAEFGLNQREAAAVMRDLVERGKVAQQRPTGGKRIYSLVSE